MSKTVKPKIKKSSSGDDDFTPIVLKPEDRENVATFHAFSIGDVDYHGLCSVPFDVSRSIVTATQRATKDQPVDLDRLVGEAVYGEEGWEALINFESLRAEDYRALVTKAVKVVYGPLAKK